MWKMTVTVTVFFPFGKKIRDFYYVPEFFYIESIGRKCVTNPKSRYADITIGNKKTR